MGGGTLNAGFFFSNPNKKKHTHDNTMPGQFANALQLVATDEHNRTLWATEKRASPWRAELKRTMNYTIDSVAVQIASNEMGRSTTTVVPKEADLLTGLSVVIAPRARRRGSLQRPGRAQTGPKGGHSARDPVRPILSRGVFGGLVRFLSGEWERIERDGRQLRQRPAEDCEQCGRAPPVRPHPSLLPGQGLPDRPNGVRRDEGPPIPEPVGLRRRRGRKGCAEHSSDRGRPTKPPTEGLGGSPFEGHGRGGPPPVHLPVLEEDQTVDTTEPLAITQVQTYTRHFDRSMPRQAIELDFHHPCRELLWRCDVDLSDVASSSQTR